MRPCDLCNATDPVPLLVKDGYPVVRCHRCGLVYVGVAPARAMLEEFYGRDYFEGEVFDGYTGEQDVRIRLGAARTRELARQEPGGRLLDVGCAAGFFLAPAAERYDVAGVEISEYAAQFARDRFGLDVVTGELAEAAFPDASFDVVTLWDTIEHLVSPRETMREVSRITRPGGLVVVSTGNVESRLARRGLDRWSLLAPPGHLFFFSPDTLGRLLRDCGFTPTRRRGDGIVSTRPRLQSYPVALPLGRLGIGNVITLSARRAPA
jgi:SAM-dependent methyltransferase